MKKCPNCQKEFPDTMRFCQTDGTPLLDVIEETQADDPLKTTVVRQEDIASSIPQSDPYKTVVGNASSNKDDSGDLLQLPEEFDPMKTMVVAPLGQDKPVLEDPKPTPPKFEDIKQEIKPETPSSPFGGYSTPQDPLPEPPKDYSSDPTLLQPEPPKFNEPNLSPPPFGGFSAKDEPEEDLPQTVMQNPWDSAPQSEQSPFSSNSPFSKPNDAPMSSPFDAPKPLDETKPYTAPKSTFDEPQSPFGGAPSSPFDAPSSSSSFDQPQSSPFDASPSSFDSPKPSFQEPPNQFGSPASQFDQMNQGFGANQPLQQSEWNTAGASPEQSWQNQGQGGSAPVAAGGQNQVLPIVSLVFGIISICCYVSPLTGLIALITGFLGMKNANNNPAQYGGKALAIAGMVTGGLFFLIGIAYYALIFLGIAGNLLAR